MAKRLVSLTVEEDLHKWIVQTQGKGNISSYVNDLIKKAQGKGKNPLVLYNECIVNLEHEERKLKLISKELSKMAVEAAIKERNDAEKAIKEEQERIDFEKSKYKPIVEEIKKTAIYKEFVTYYKKLNGDITFENMKDWIAKFQIDYGIRMGLYDLRKINEYNLIK